VNDGCVSLIDGAANLFCQKREVNSGPYAQEKKTLATRLNC